MLAIDLSRRNDHFECDECGHVWEQPLTATRKMSPRRVVPGIGAREANKSK